MILRWYVGDILSNSNELIILNSEISNNILNISTYHYASSILFQRTVKILLPCHFLIIKGYS